MERKREEANDYDSLNQNKMQVGEFLIPRLLLVRDVPGLFQIFPEKEVANRQIRRSRRPELILSSHALSHCWCGTGTFLLPQKSLCHESHENPTELPDSELSVKTLPSRFGSTKCGPRIAPASSCYTCPNDHLFGTLDEFNVMFAWVTVFCVFDNIASRTLSIFLNVELN